MDARKYVAAGAAALVMGGGLGAAVLANAADPTPSPTAAPSAGSTATPGTGQGQAGQGQPGKGGKDMGGERRGAGVVMRDEVAQAVADKLGIDKTTLTDAAKAVADELRAQHQAAGQTGTKPDRDAMRDEALTALANKLGVDKAKLVAAVDEAEAAQQAAHLAEGRADFKTRIDQAVADGKITQADADSILKGYDAGLLGGGRGTR